MPAMPLQRLQLVFTCASKNSIIYTYLRSLIKNEFKIFKKIRI